MTKKLLIIVDREHKEQVALDRGLALAEALGAEVEIVAFCFEYLQDLPESLRVDAKRMLLDNKKYWFDEMLQDYPVGDRQVRAEVIWHKAIHEWICDRCEQGDIQGVIKTAHRSGTLTYTSTDWHLLRSCNAPVLLLAEHKWRKARPVLAAVDLGSQKPEKQALNHLVLAESMRMASALDTHVQVVHVITLPTFLKDLDIIDVDVHTAAKMEELQPTVAALSEQYGIPRERFHLRHGYTHKVIPSVANKVKADLLVMGTVGRQGLAGKVIGNTAERVLQHLRTDVMALKVAE